jgi:predicted anti-sigma-YlaC factor YlaD
VPEGIADRDAHTFGAVGHVSREGAAWSGALAVAFGWAALRPARVAGLVPAIGAFMVVTGAVSVSDLFAGHAEPAREAVHLLPLAGLILLIWPAGGLRGPRPPTVRSGVPAPMRLAAVPLPAPSPQPDPGATASATRRRDGAA